MDQSSERPHAPGAREHVLPTGASYLVFLLSGDPLRLFEGAGDAEGRTVSTAVVGGARSRYYIRDTSAPPCSIGAELLPGAAERLFGASQAELAERHTPLELLWGRHAGLAREQLLEAAGPQAQLAAFEDILATRLRASSKLHPAVAHALAAFQTEASIAEVVRSSGYSHRFVAQAFRRFTGLAPKAYCRVLRFQQALEKASAGQTPWAEIAAEAGYSDQAHFSREFRTFAGVAPSAYRKIGPDQANHLPLPRD